MSNATVRVYSDDVYIGTFDIAQAELYFASLQGSPWNVTFEYGE